MAAAYQLEIQGASSNHVFGVEGAFFPRLEPVYKTAANPPQIVALRETWEFRGCRILSSDDTVATLWSEWAAFLARIKSRTAHPTYARVVIPGGATLMTIGPSTYEQFQIELVEGEQDPDVPAASFRTVAACTLRVSAVLKNPEAVTGLVEWEQEVEVTYRNGLAAIEWRTVVGTAEGTSAVTKAQTYAKITASALGANYLYETNGPDGIEYVKLDADEQNSRSPTRVRAVSRVQSYGISFGTVTPGQAPSAVSYSTTTKTTATETITTTAASAQGPGALSFVLSRAPAVYAEREVMHDPALGLASGLWTTKAEKPKDPKTKWTMSVSISGGGRSLDYEKAANGLPPARFRGALQEFVAVVDVEREAVGGDGAPDELTLPGPPGAPWDFDSAASTEGEPFISERSSSGQHTWRREARLVFRSAGPIPIDRGVLERMRDATELESYVVGDALAAALGLANGG